ncbi:MAG: ATP-binding protein [Thermodesulfobacteriota bacterium]|nr:ATP-binding protein [Thermodesulfobacteriota bacterium]
MIITIASGKGGTGKTTVSVNLAACAKDDNAEVFDCDVEEPNAHIFIKPQAVAEEDISTMIPEIDKDKCTLCGECEKICQFSAIAIVANKIMTFPEMCHSCRGCSMVCPENAVIESSRILGKLKQGRNLDNIKITWGELRVGEAMSPPLIEQVKDRMNKDNINIVDAPPGTSCPAIAALRDSDYALLVAEPTPFGLNDLTLTVEALKKISVPFGIVINRAEEEESIVDTYAEKENIEILQRFPFSREAAAVCSKGLLLTEEIPEMNSLFKELYKKLKIRAEQGKSVKGGKE